MLVEITFFSSLSYLSLFLNMTGLPSMELRGLTGGIVIVIMNGDNFLIDELFVRSESVRYSYGRSTQNYGGWIIKKNS